MSSKAYLQPHQLVSRSRRLSISDGPVRATVLSAGRMPWHVFVESMLRYGVGAGEACLALGGFKMQRLVLVVSSSMHMTAASNDFQFDSIPDGTSYLPGATLHTLDLSILTGRQDTSTGAALPVADVNAAYLHQIGDSANLFSLTSAGLSLVLDQDREYVIIGELLKSNTAVVHNHINDRPCLSRVVGGVWVIVVQKLCTGFIPHTFVAQ
ncbi:uncharacterized protein PSANT_06986 [Moesziomyces antarcticus]|uniref:Uncharacterized protein n=1 Tax=Pseudozyma antarctica TaxID=84753 RepID=A0A5C3FZJ2_PSEA2|nr:uncharacterized protein PSANT_06986 [Moesziomyces antarcticus]